MKNLYSFHYDCGRMGELNGRFLATQAEVEANFGKMVSFYDVLGKHSEVHIRLSDENITLVTDNREFLAKATDLGIDLENGINPLHYFNDEENFEN